MSRTISAQQFYAETYDVCMSDWPGEIDFYREIAAEEIKSQDGMVLDIACGTGRIGLRLAESGALVVGLDSSPEMLGAARQKSKSVNRVRWVEGDMRSFEFDKKFDLVLIPSHSFQNLSTPNDQAACIERVWRHLKPGGLLVVHLDHMNGENIRWLGEISGEKRGLFEHAESFKHPNTGILVRTSRAWSYEPATQTAAVQTHWEEIMADGRIVNRWDTGEIRLHCVFRFEMEHLLKQAGFKIEYIYGDFYRQELQDDSPHMIWLARKISDDL